MASTSRTASGIAYVRTMAAAAAAPALQRRPGFVFVNGYRSVMSATKPRHVEAFCWASGLSNVRFDFRGVGESSDAKRFEECTVSTWLDDALEVLDTLTEHDEPQVLVGSSIGGWIALLAALRRPERVAGIVAVAPGVDTTRDLVERRMTPEQRNELFESGSVRLPSAYDAAGYVYTAALVRDAAQHHMLLDGSGRLAALRCPVHILHGTADTDVPPERSIALRDALAAAQLDVSLTLIDNGDHRLSSPEHLAVLTAAISRFL